MPEPNSPICIPNFNDARYIGHTNSSALAQRFDDFEIVISDNASTDGSAELIRSFADLRIRLHVNRCKVGFAANLDRMGAMAFLLLKPLGSAVACSLKDRDHHR